MRYTQLKKTIRVDCGCYTKRRRNEYPPIAEQLDALYWAIKDDDELAARFQAFLAPIDRVKARHPKPQK
ncbi:hypothetical protein Axy19_062 [Achromobacter phage vB_AxyS_19-32_Axy19]|nr:hypothetical protein Axy19_062 [Achromobacter phage vB_AxyS_19-32_Axy19]